MCMMKFELSKVEGYGGLGGSRITSGDKVTIQYLELKGGDRGACKLLGESIRGARMPCLESFGCLKRILPQEVSDFSNPVIEKNVAESLEAAVLTRSASQTKSTYKAATSLSKFELTKILIDKMEKNKSYDKDYYKKELYDALIKSYETDKDLFDSYGEAFTLKRNSWSKEKNSSSTSKDASQSQHKSFGKSAHAEELSHTVEDSGMQQDQEFVMGDNDEQPADKEVTKADWFKKPERPTTPDYDWNKRQQAPAKSLTELEYHLEECSKATTERINWHNPEGKPYPFDLSKPLSLILDHRGHQVIPQDFFINNDLEYLKGGDLSRRYSTSVTKTKAATYEIKWIEDLGPKRQHFYGFAANMTSSKDVYSRKRIIAVTRLTIMKKYDYGHLEEIEVHRDDQKLYKFREGDFPRLHLQDIEYMLLLLVQKKLTNLTIDKRYDLNVALRMFTRWIVIQRRVEDLQLGIKSYQKKLNLTKPDTFRLMRADELHKFSDGMLNDVWTILNHIAKGIMMEYLPKRKWSG
ncbi:hypothetical protein Tco_0689627 [Tanacetum coccineum]